MLNIDIIISNCRNLSSIYGLYSIGPIEIEDVKLNMEFVNNTGGDLSNKYVGIYSYDTTSSISCNIKE